MRRARGRSVFWGQDHLRRAHRAMLDWRSSDLLTLARVALEAAIRSDDDLRDLLDTGGGAINVPCALQREQS